MKKLALLLVPILLWGDSFSSNPKASSSTVFSQTASVTVTNTVTETSVVSTGAGTVTFPANYFAAGTSITIRLWGIHTATGNPTIRWRVKLGSVVLLDSTAVTSQTSTNQAMDVDGVITCRTTGASGTFIGQGKYIEVGNLLQGMANTTTATVDTTVAQTLDVTIQWGTAAVGDSVTVTNLTVDGKLPGAL